MKNYFKYLTPGEEDKRWGIYLNVAGQANIPAHSIYPSPKHPSGYYFTWDKGRVLDEYQLVYITEGHGVMETTGGQFDISAGALLFIRPGEKHRYRPSRSTGWKENFIGFNGPLVAHFYEQYEFLRTQSVLNFGVQSTFLDTYIKIYQLIENEKPGFQQIVSGHILQLLGDIAAKQKQGAFSDEKIESTIQQTLIYMRENVEENIDLQLLAKQHHISYASFRKLFKKYTGVPPRQYHIELKLLRAKELLLTTQKSIQQISQELNFESIHYFSRYFKKKMGDSPSQLRKKMISLL